MSGLIVGVDGEPIEEDSAPNGQTNVSDLKKAGMNQRAIEDAVRRSDATRKHMSGPGELNLPDLMDKRRLDYGIVDRVFSRQALFDRVFVWRIPGESFGEGGVISGSESGIVAPVQTQRSDEIESPRGVIVSAGLAALSDLRSNGIDVGHIVSIGEMAPYGMSFGYVGTQEQKVVVVTAGFLVGSEDLSAALKAGKVEISQDEIGGELKLRDTETRGPWDPSNV